MGTKHHSSDPVSDPKKRRRVGFSQIDAGIEANDCIKIYLGSLNLGLVAGVASSNLILVLPPYQHKGYGRHLLEVLNNVAICENVYDLTIEEPLDSLQHVRTCIDVGRLLVFNPIQKALDSTILRLKQENLSKKSQTSCFGPPPSAIDHVRKSLKINKKQFQQCWEVLIYLGLDFVDKQIDNFMTVISDRVRADVIGKDSGAAEKRVIEFPTDYDQEMSFVMFRCKNGEASRIDMDENQTNQEQQLKELVDERMKEIKSIAQKVCPRSS
ncbi:hypothetical protein TEA_008449 [Camellia sinensis var. sinensis]|uniref:Histone acetyltransferase n=1 Tax=Camellia sinensis var. sinensis TaxID=542762 RepID=A0A4S4DZ06_CAMSN|nr:hypothetical protein TEA_008449 [Camellia sinensis var. sinensis]